MNQIKINENDLKKIINKSISFILLYEIYNKTKTTINESSYAENIDNEYYYAADFNDVANLRGSLLKVAYGLTKNKDKAEDLVQSTIMRAFEKNELFKDGTNLFGWLKTIMTNIFKRDVNNPRKNLKYVDDYSSYDKLSQEDPDYSDYGAKGKSNFDDIVDRMNKSIDILASKKGKLYKEIFDLKVKGEKVKDISKKLNINFENTKYYLKIIRNYLRNNGFNDEIKNFIEF